MTAPGPTVDARWFREVLGQYPTGVCAITAMGADGRPVGMSVGSFTSVSLEPPLVGFLPDRRSSSWPKIRQAGRFCVNVLGAEQEHVCRAFATKGGDKFAGLSWSCGPTGSPIIDGIVAWIDCELEAVHDAGDHEIAIGRVHDLDIAQPSMPLLFFKGGYGRFATSSLAALDADLITQLRVVDVARPHMEQLAAAFDGECVANAIAGDEVVVLASAGAIRRSGLVTRIGQRLPWMPPFGVPFVAWATDEETTLERWIGRAGTTAGPEQTTALRAKLARARRRGFSVQLESDRHEELARDLAGRAANAAPAAPERLRVIADDLADLYEPTDAALSRDGRVRRVAVPVLDARDEVVLSLNLVAAEPLRGNQLGRYAEKLHAAAAEIRTAIMR